MYSNMPEQSVLTPATETMFVMRAMAGDADAFDALVRHYRQQALTRALQLTKDVHLAEDVVQNAWIRAYTHINKLAQAERFWPWFRRIVYTEAMMLLRRGGPHRHESPISSFADVDERHLQVSDDPSIHMLRAEEERRLQHVMADCLKPRERLIARERFLGDAPITELSRQFALSASNTYQVISRSRTKLQKHLVQTAVRDYVLERNTESGRDTNQVESLLYVGEFWSSAAFFLLWALQYADTAGRSIAEVMGLTGHAFRLCVRAECVDGSGSFAFDWGEHFSIGLANLGFQARHVGGYGYSNPVPYKLVEAIHLIHQSVDNGIPAVIWEASYPWFAVVTSYHDESAMLDVLGFAGQRTIPYSDLGKGEYANLFVLNIGRPAPLNPLIAFKRALQMAVAHGESSDTVMPGYVHGLAAYDAWMDALAQRRVDKCGNALMAAVLAEARGYAAAFLSQPMHRWLGAHPRRHKIQHLCLYAAEQYSCAASAALEVRRLFPFPSFGDPFHLQTAERAISHLMQARRAEGNALSALRRLLELL